MNKQKYYIISLKHTSVRDTALLFWRSNCAGYTWDKSAAGIYTDADRSKVMGDDNVFVEQEKVDPLFKPGSDYEDDFVALPNTKEIRLALGLDIRAMKPAHSAQCRIVFR